MSSYKIIFASAACSVLVPSAFLAGEARATALSTATARTNMDAIEVMSYQLGDVTNRAIQDHFYDGSRQIMGIRGGAVTAGAPGSNTAPTAKYTAQAAGRIQLKGIVPPLQAQEAGTKAPAAKSLALETAATPAAPALPKGPKPLTPVEIETAKTVFNGKIDYSKVKIITGKDMTLWGKILTHGGKAVVWGNKMYFPNDSNGQSKFDFGKDPAWYMHEITHVYQYQNRGWSYVPKSLWAQITDGQGAYDYQLVPGKAFKDYQIEQQAEIVRDYYYGVTGRSAATPAEKELLAATLKGEGLLQ